MSNSPINTAPPAEEEISLIDILRFLKGAFKTILVFGILEIAAAANKPEAFAMSMN